MLSISPRQAYSFVVEFSQQLHSIFSSKVAFYFIRDSSYHFLFRSFLSTLLILSGGFVSCFHQVSFHLVKFLFFSFHFQPECCLNPFSFIRFLSRCNRSAFIVYLIPWAFDSCHSRRSSLLLECSRFFASSLELLLHLFIFLFHLGPKISGRDLLLVEECCNAPVPMR